MTAILVTGGTGLVGARLLPRLVDAGTACRAIVLPGKDLPSGVEPIEGDLLDPASLTQALEGVTAIVHLAALFRTADTDAIWRVNLEGTRNLIAAAHSHAPAARFVMASTGRVYDDDLSRPAQEIDPATAQATYPASKLAAEQELRESGLTWSILRFGFVYGDGDGHLQAVPGMLATWGWHPAHTMSLVHHRDIATAVELALTGVADGQILNIIDESPLSLFEIAAIVGTTYEPSAEPLTNPWMGHMDGSRARGLGYQPTVPTAYHAAREGAL
jgi:nucleoside-diphosphate-sugar epimerase